MMIDFALELERKENKGSNRSNFMRGLFIRFRPILMTTLAALLSAIPRFRYWNGF